VSAAASSWQYTLKAEDVQRRVPNPDKPEIQNPKYETISKDQNSNVSNKIKVATNLNRVRKKMITVKKV
jgi:hypothetical protein